MSREGVIHGSFSRQEQDMRKKRRSQGFSSKKKSELVREGRVVAF